MFRHADIGVHGGKLSVWNSDGIHTSAYDFMEETTQATTDHPELVWTGSDLRTLNGEYFVSAHLEQGGRAPGVDAEDPNSPSPPISLVARAVLHRRKSHLVLARASIRAWYRVEGLQLCSRRCSAHLPISITSHGPWPFCEFPQGLGFRCVAYWASWANRLHTRRRQPEFAARRSHLC